MSRQTAVRDVTPLIPGPGAKVVVDFATVPDALTRCVSSAEAWRRMPETRQKNFRARLGPDGRPRAEAGAG
jgi:hypothetical protein